jgi:hypothetical protein
MISACDLDDLLGTGETREPKAKRPPLGSKAEVSQLERWEDDGGRPLSRSLTSFASSRRVKASGPDSRNCLYDEVFAFKSS